MTEKKFTAKEIENMTHASFLLSIVSTGGTLVAFGLAILALTRDISETMKTILAIMGMIFMLMGFFVLIYFVAKNRKVLDLRGKTPRK